MLPEPSLEPEVLVITDPEQDRYASMRLIPWWDQAVLSAAHVMVVGAGALGNEVLKNLALVGIGHIFVVDFDQIEMSNLARAVLFRAEDVGRAKAEVAAERVRMLNPDTSVQSFHGDIVRELGLGVFRRMDIVIGCLDNREARWAVNRACWRLGKPWVDGGLDALSGAVKVFIPPEGACYECGLTEPDRQAMTLRYSCPGLRSADLLQGRTPTTITSAAIIAGVQVQEVLKLLHQRHVPPGSGFIYDGLSSRALNVTLARRAACLAHESYAPVIELEAGAGTMSLGDLLRVAQAHLGVGAFITFDRHLITHLICPGCEATELVMQPYDQMAKNLICQVCGERRFPDLTYIINEQTPGLATCLADLGIPRLHILAASNGEQTIYLELSGDRQEFLAPNEGDQQ